MVGATRETVQGIRIVKAFQLEEINRQRMFAAISSVEKLANKLLQSTLHDLGYFLGKAGVDGVRGPLTRAALDAFQRAQGLTPDQIDGPKTWAALATATEKAA